MSEIASAVAGTVDDLFGTDGAAPEPNSPEPAAETPQDAAPAAALPELNPELPEEYEDLFDTPDFDEEDEPEPQYGTVELGGDEEYVDPDALARENAKLKKQLAWTEAQKQKASKKSWAAEAQKIAPLSQPDKINATSRRGFLREARKQHEENFALLAPHIDAFKAAEAELKAQLAASVKAEQERGWGKPVNGSGGAPVEGVRRADDLERARNSRNLTSVVKEMIKGNQI